MKRKITILGSGVWATALSQAINPSIQVSMFSIEKEVIQSIKKGAVHPRFPQHKLSNNLTITDNINEALEGAELVLESVTSQGFVSALSKIKTTFPLLITSKGIDEQGRTLFEIATDLGFNKVAVLSGATFADEVMKKQLTAANVASFDPLFAQSIIPLFNREYFHIEQKENPIACGIGGSLKNIYAILCGVLQGLGYGFNARAALIAKAFSEMKDFGKIKGIDSKEFEGYSGLADLILTCSSEKSRNFQCGLLLAEGAKREDLMTHIGMVVEGAYAAKALQGTKGIAKMPIASVVYEMLYENLPIKEGLERVFQYENSPIQDNFERAFL